MKTNWIVPVLVLLVLSICAILFRSEFVAAEKLSPATNVKTDDGNLGIDPTDQKTQRLGHQMSVSEAIGQEAYPSGKMRERGDFVLGAVFALDTIIDMRNDEVRRASPDRKDSLAGIEGVTVVVDPLPEVKRSGLTRRLLQTDAELRLRQEGISILTSKEVGRGVENGQKKQQERWQELGLKILSLPETLTQNDSDEHFWKCLRMLIPEYLQETCGPPPFLSVTVHPIVSEENGRVVFSVDLKLNDGVYVRRNGALRVAAIWETGAVATCSSSDLEEYARRCLRDCLDEFIDDYLAVNPKNLSLDRRK